MDVSPVLQALDYAGVVVFAISGALVAARARMDVVGFALIGIVTGIGGGTLRDLLLGRVPVYWVQQPEYLLLCVLASTLTFFAVPLVSSRLTFLLWADAVGLSVFAVLGAQTARSTGAPLVIATLMGVVTATFGGIIRDVLCRETPLILLKEVYATAALAGAVTFLLAMEWGVERSLALGVGCLVAFSLRGVGLLYGLSLPAFIHPNDRPGRPGPTPRR